MYDPLGSSSGVFGAVADDITPPWPTTPHAPNSPIPNLRRATTPVPPTPDKGPTPGIYGKEPQIYGQPEAGLISPRDTVGSNGTKFEKPEPYLRVRILGLDRNRRDILIKFDAQTNLSNFTGTTYRNVSRSYFEFQQFFDSVVHSNPQTIVPALPLAQTSAPTDEEDDRLVRIMLQRWITRVCEDPILLHDEDLRSFIESDFGYQPTPRPRRKASSGFGLMRRGVPDEDEELQKARFELTKLEGQFFDTAKAVDKLAMARKSLASAHAEMGNKLINVATTESHPPLGNALRKLGRTWHSLADLDQAQAISECVIMGDSLGYQGTNARSAKETLLLRTGVLEEYQAAVKMTITKRRNIERLKASSNIRPERVDEALEDMEEANKYEQVLARRAEGISQNLHQALITHNKYANDDITSALIEHARSSIMYERQLLRELEALRADVNGAAKKVAPSTDGTPKPTIIPPLEDYSNPSFPRAVESAPITNGFHQISPPGPPKEQRSYDRDPLSQGPLSFQRPSSSQTSGQAPSSPVSPQTAPAFQSTMQRPSPIIPPQTYVAPRAGQFTSSPVTPSPLSRQTLPPQSPKSSTGPSSPVPAPEVPTPQPAEDGPPLGGKFIDGTKSMFAKPPTSPLPLSTSSASIFSGPSRVDVGDPLLGGATVSHGTSSFRLGMNGHGYVPSPLANDLDPLGHARPRAISASVRVQPTRPRLDAREAASKLANMF